MNRVVARALLVVVAATVAPQVSAAQEGVGVGFTDIGAVVGLGGIGGASISLGGRYEKIIKPLPDLGDGLLGIQLGVDWWSWNYNDCGSNSSSISYIPIGLTANYHFKMENKKIDPFLGAGLGYQIVNASCVFNGIDYCSGSYSSGIYFVTKAGIRYFMSQAMALYADVGVGAATLNAGLTWKIGSGS